MVRSVLLLAWISFFLAAEQVFAQSGLFQEEASYDLPSYAETRTVEAEHSSTNPASSFRGDSVAWEESTNQTAERATRLPDQTIFNERGLGQYKEASSFRVLFRKLGAFCAVLLCVGLLTTAVRRRAAAIESGEERIKKIESRLQKVKALLPAAEALASVVGSEESHKLLKTFREIVGENDFAAENARGVRTAETSLADALKTLRTLHQVALQEAGGIVRADRSVPELSTLGFPRNAAEEALVALEGRSELRTTRPLIRTYRSLLENCAALAERVQSIAERLSSQRPFESEEDKKVLLSTASAFGVLRATTASRKRLADFGQEIGSAVVEGVKLTFAEYHEQVLLDFEREFQVIELCSALRKNAAEGSAAAQVSSADARELPFDGVEEGIRDAKALLTQLRLSAEELRASTSLPVAAATSEKLFDAEERARGLLRKWSQVKDSLSDLPADLDDQSRLMALQMGISNAAFVQKEYEHVTQSLQRVRERMNIVWHELPETAVLSQVMVTDLTENAEATTLIAKERALQTDTILRNLKKEKDARAAVEELMNISVNGLFQNMDRRHLNSLELSCQLVTFLEDDVSLNITQAGSMASEIFRLYGHETREYKELQERFTAARRGVKKARNLLEAANAAAEMSAHLFSMQQLLLPVSEGDQP